MDSPVDSPRLYEALPYPTRRELFLQGNTHLSAHKTLPVMVQVASRLSQPQPSSLSLSLSIYMYLSFGSLGIPRFLGIPKGPWSAQVVSGYRARVHPHVLIFVLMKVVVSKNCNLVPRGLPEFSF